MSGEPEHPIGESKVSFGSIRLPNSVRPQATIDASINVTNNALDPPLIGDDGCSPEAWFRNGTSITVSLIVGQQSVDEGSQCIPDGGGKKDYSLTWATPSVPEGETRTITARYEARGSETGNLYARTSKEVTVSGQAPEQPEDPGGGGDGDFSGIVELLNYIGENARMVVLGVTLILLLIVLAPVLASLIDYSAAAQG